LTRIYIGTSGTLNIQSMLTIGAEIWAGNATVVWESTSDMFGAIFAHDFQVISDLNLHQDQGVTRAGDICPPPGSGGAGGATGSGGTTGSGGAGGGTCGTCKDCGNQACINGACGQCSTDGQCCPPLVCVSGTCQPIVIVN